MTKKEYFLTRSMSFNNSRVLSLLGNGEALSRGIDLFFIWTSATMLSSAKTCSWSGMDFEKITLF